ncbi:MAG: META domain-containing protein [Pseudomonadota bacterium]
MQASRRGTGPVRHRLAVLVAVVALHAGGALAEDRVVRGEVTYPQRIALPADSLVVVELRAVDESLVAEARIDTEGRQVPIAFRIQAPVERELVFRGGITVDGQPAWISEPIVVAAGSERVDLGLVRLQPFRPMGFASTLRCGDTVVEVGFVDQIARLRIGERYVDLVQVPAASGAKFEAADDPSTFFWSHGDRAQVGLEGTTLPECATVADDTVRARGNEPGWNLTLDDDRMVLVTDYGATRLETLRPDASVEGGVTSLAVPAFGVAVRLTDSLCHDDMTGMPYPRTAVVDLADRTLRGCAGEPRTLLVGPEWIVEDVAGTGIVDRSRITLTFDDAGRLAGSAGCNRFTTSYTLTGEGLSVARPAATMMACPEALMNQERRFLEALAATTAFDIDRTGALVLSGAGERLLLARR